MLGGWDIGYMSRNGWLTDVGRPSSVVGRLLAFNAGEDDALDKVALGDEED